jgi:hypothetical protein
MQWNIAGESDRSFEPTLKRFLCRFRSSQSTRKEWRTVSVQVHGANRKGLVLVELQSDRTPHAKHNFHFRSYTGCRFFTKRSDVEGSLVVGIPSEYAG